VTGDDLAPLAGGEALGVRLIELVKLILKVLRPLAVVRGVGGVGLRQPLAQCPGDPREPDRVEPDVRVLAAVLGLGFFLME